jgi:hypothetical protein
MADSDRNLRINNGFIRLLAAESARLGPGAQVTLTFDEQGLSVRERYAPMHRLLAQDDESFLASQGAGHLGKGLQREHRACYFDYVRRLTAEVRSARKLRALAMASQENWSFWLLSERALLSEASLVYLRWLGCRHALGIRVSARDVRECLDLLLAGPRFQLATT